MVYRSSESFTVNGDDLERGYHGRSPTYRSPGRPTHGNRPPSVLNLTTAMSVNARHTATPLHHLSNPFDTDLADARLRYGPSALRSAVEAVSPERRKKGHGSETSQLRASVSVSPRHNHATFLDMNLSASTFTPVFAPLTAPSKCSLPPELEKEIGPLNVSLVNAVNRERKAHQETKTILARLQQENQKYEKTNASLSASVKMLGTIVKYNMEQMDAMRNAATEDARAAAVKAIYAGVSDSAEKKDSILYDVLANQRQAYESEGYPEALNVDNDNGPTAMEEREVGQKISDKNLFDFNALTETGFSNNNGKAGVDPYIMRQILNLQEISGGPIPDGKGKTAEDAEHVLVSLSPELTKAQPLQLHPLQSQVHTKELEEMAASQPGREILLAEKPVLQVGDSFLQNLHTYRKKPENAASSAQNPHPTPDSAPVTVSDQPATVTENTKGDSSETPTSTTFKSAAVTTLPKFMNLDIKWKLPYSNPVFVDDNDRRETLGPLTYGNNAKSAFWKHPVRYLPKEGATEKNIYRTAMMDYIPFGTSYREVLDQIRGGSLESIQIVANIGNATDYLTARVVFNYEHAANILCVRAQKNGIFIHGQPVRVWQVLQPTYPKNTQLEEDVFEEGYTRLLLMDNVRADVLAVLHEKLARQIRASFVIDIGCAADGVPMVEFTSVAEAGRAVRQLSLDPDFRGVKWDFENDYCEGPYKD